MDIKPIKTDADYHAGLKEIESLMMAGPDTPEGEKLDVMVTLIEAYEAKHFPMDLPDPVEAIKFEMERKGLTVKDLEPMIGKSNRVYEILNYKRSLTLKGHRTSVSLEDEFWYEFRRISEERNLPINALAAEIDVNRTADIGLASAIRLYVLGMIKGERDAKN